MIGTKHANRLIDSTSPYLLQHAHNPVDWYPWGPEALERAKKEDKPIFLSIGYSACHWCHVMERESFENDEIANIMNEHFICIKVDREERPDLDAIYMNAVQLMTGSGGWPMSVFLTPDLEPFFGGTYFPPEDRYGRAGFKRVLLSVAQVYREKRGEIEQRAGRLRGALSKLGGSAAGKGALTGKPIEQAVRELAGEFDPAWGGFGQAPKFPQASVIRLLLRHHKRTGDEEALRMATVTLDRMACGGIYDHLGGGFHRYSTDREWLVPHFEKMLYDNAQLAAVYLDAYQLTGKPLYRRVAKETLDYVLRDMTDESGGFHSTRDADSEGEEGKYYVWDCEEALGILGEEDGALFCEYYGVTESGNFEGRSILHVPLSIKKFAKKRGKGEAAVQSRLDHMRRRLLTVRDERVAPGKDDQILTDWNGLTISALARGYHVLGDETYRAAAEKAAEFILTKMKSGNRLLHAYRKGRSHIDANLDDYAYMTAALVDLYEATFDVRWIEEAKALANDMIKNFRDDANGGFFFTPEGRADLIVRNKSAHDGATPSGNAVAALALLRLAALTDDAALNETAVRTLRAFKVQMERSPAGYASLLAALDFHLGPVKEVVVCGEEDRSETQALLSAVRLRYLPNNVIALYDPQARNVKGAFRTLPMLQGKEAANGTPTAYVCVNRTCSAPVTSPEALAKLLDSD
ncbi:MAG: thioredoxin domain-containing protein [Planctomycetes bacterium]|nr:thioredoxin domain-containing protein [Planctomycetota bacterium]